MADLPGGRPLGWPETLLARTGLAPFAAALLAAGVAFALCVAGNNLAGAWEGFRTDGVLFYEATFGRMGLVVSVLVGYLAVWPGSLARGGQADFEAMRPALQCSAADCEALRAALTGLDARAARRSRLAGAALLPQVPVLMAATSEPGFAIFLPAHFEFNTAWSLVFVGLLYWLIGRALYFCWRQVRAYGALAAQIREPDPLDPEPVLAFGRGATRGALGWIGSASISAFLLSNPSFVLPLLPVLAATLVVTGFVFFGTTLPIRRRVQRTRADELARVRTAARLERGALYEGEPSGRLAALLAWEEHVREWSSWPFETPVALRGVLLVLLPLGSWVGGALVERLLEWGLQGAG